MNLERCLRLDTGSAGDSGFRGKMNRETGAFGRSWMKSDKYSKKKLLLPIAVVLKQITDNEGASSVCSIQLCVACVRIFIYNLH